MSRILFRAGITAATVALAATTLAACGSDSSGETITFAAVPAESSSTLESSFGNITALIEQETGVKVEFQNASDYAAVIEGMRAGQVDVASFGPFSYVIARDSGVDMEPVVAPTNDVDEAPAYTSLAYVRQDSDIRGIEDLRGKTVCFVDQASTSGYLVPMKGLLDVDLDLDSDLTPVMAGGHDASLLTLDTEGCDAAFAHNTMLTTLERTGQVEEGALRPVWESDPITEDPIAVNRGTLDPELADKITSVLREKGNKPALVEAGICSSEEDCVLPEETGYGYVPVSDADFNPIREICEQTDADACKNVG
ncbi:phosphate/phosphite/phosphonate ABC transporter substrate-binding protein [Corynebacterium comes]|uniref:Phosphate-import protein PhnD n=1 Tax=Corynebacterium comes TaxID=2675218 RepID=A0A6B8W2S8_9CORY|nr:phosphate/phosphite/phosphonate ABC transporter substrate-binding protein [Corynebacterium comes]QGU05226.1 Phosphate-import protein PhnD precursor [Corynebacterium comes]